MKKLISLALLFVASLGAGVAFGQTQTPNVGLGLVPGDQSFSNNMYLLDNILVGSRASVITSVVPIATTTFTSTSLVFPPVPAGKTYHGSCNIVWEQATGVSTVQFGVGQTVVPTNLWALSVLSYGSAGGSTQVAYGTQNATTPTAVSGAVAAPGAIATGYREVLNITVVNGVAGADTVTVYGLTGNTADALQIMPGSFCDWSI